MLTSCLMNITIPGTQSSPRDDNNIKQLMSILDKHGIEHNFFDTIPGWGCLNQDWLEFKCEADTSFDWCTIVAFSEIEKEWLTTMLHTGKLLMHVRYIGEKEYIPHS